MSDTDLYQKILTLSFMVSDLLYKEVIDLNKSILLISKEIDKIAESLLPQEND